MNAFIHWIDDRTGLVTALDRHLDRRVPGGPSWRYVLPATLLFAFIVEALSGVVLWMCYSPGAQSAWESIFWIQECTRAGWLVRGLHFYTGNAMVVLAGLYLMQLILTGVYRAPREFVFWVAILLFLTLLALLLTGDLLRWDQEGYWSTQVRVRFATLLPLIGADAFKLAAGGTDFGHITLTHFFALHAGVCSVALLVLLLWHNWLVRRHGLSDAGRWSRKVAGRYWPGQSLRNFLACSLVLGAVLWLLARPELQGTHPGQSRGQYLGAPLGAPADPGEAYSAARPEWAFLALYQFANMFPGEGLLGSNISWKVVPIFVVTGAVVCLLFLMPLIARLRWQLPLIPLGHVSAGHVFNVLVFLFLLTALVKLSMMALAHDRDNADYQAAVTAGHRSAERVKELARAQGIPPTGALTLLRNDPQTQGPKLFAQHCASCHNHTDAAGSGIRAAKSSAPNLYDFASRQWIGGLLDPKQIAGPSYFGDTKFHKGRMVEHIRSTLKDILDDKDDGPRVKQQLELVAIALSAEAHLKRQQAQDQADAQRIQDGQKALGDEVDCLSCHRFHGKGSGIGPDQTGYGSREWLVGIISNPADKRFYGEPKKDQGNDRMPAYAESLSHREIEMLAEWLRGD